MLDALNIQMRVIAEDLHIQSRYERLEIPLDITPEIHTRVDTTTLEFRRVVVGFLQKAEVEVGRAGEI